jgi:hypothetical protein
MGEGRRSEVERQSGRTEDRVKLDSQCVAYVDGTLTEICKLEAQHKSYGEHTVVYLQGGVWHLEVWI